MTAINRITYFKALALGAVFLSTVFVIKDAISVRADEQPVKPSNGTEAQTREMTAADVEAFLDGILPLQLERENIAGATVAVVKDGKLLFSKGYGYADFAKKMPVSPETTLFRPGSVSKLFTWTAVMQLHEQGKIDLDKDVNEYLDFKIPDAFGQPITLKHILTHTPGFEEQIKDLFVTDPEVPPLGDYLKTHIPTRIFPPGKVPAYSNYGTALAGYIVERVSGKDLHSYMEENIFGPLGMKNSTLVQPLPPELADKMSGGYRLATGDPVPFEMITAFPAGSLSSSANDMARFMIAHLQGGSYNGGQILRPETAKLMHSRLFAMDDAANGMAHGFYEESRNGLRIVGHGGDTIAFHSDLHLVLDKGVGFFVSYNSLGKGEAQLRPILWEAFLDRYFPYTPPASDFEPSKENAAAVSGSYMLSRRAETSFLRVASVLGQITVNPNDDNTISVNMLLGPNGLPLKWKETAPMVYTQVDGQDRIVFKPDDGGRMQLIISRYPFMIGQKVGALESSSILLPVIGASLAVMLLTLLLAPVAWFVRRRFGQPLVLPASDRWLRRGVWLVFLLILIFVSALIGLTMYGLTHIEVFSDRGTTWFHLIQVVGIVGAIGTLLVAFYAVKTWLGSRSIWAKLQSALFVMVCVGFLWFAFVSNLLILRSSY